MITKTAVQHCENCGLSCKDIIGKNIEVGPLSGGLFKKINKSQSTISSINKAMNILLLLGNLDWPQRLI